MDAIETADIGAVEDSKQRIAAIDRGLVIMSDLCVETPPCVASFLAMAETALTRINRAKAMALEDEGRRWSKQLVRLVEHPERFLNPVLLLMLLAHLVIASVVAVLIQRHFGSGLLFVATLVETAVIFVFAEAAPKTWAIEHPDRSALLSAPLVATTPVPVNGAVPLDVSIM